MGSRVRFVLMVMGAILVAACGASRGAEKPPEAAPAQAAAPATDPFPHGCVDCHVNRPDLGMDVRISTLMARWMEGADARLTESARAASPEGVEVTGRHPDPRGTLADIPGACLECHGRASDSAPRFALLMHRVHLVGGEENHYIREFAGRCEPCHKLDAKTGAWVLPSGAER